MYLSVRVLQVLDRDCSLLATEISDERKSKAMAESDFDRVNSWVVTGPTSQ